MKKSMAKRPKVLLGKPGLDGHQMGARLIAYVLRNAGMEVVYTGSRQTAEMIANVAIQEAVDVIGLSFLTGAHKEHTAKLVRLMKDKKLNDVVLVVGGIIPAKDVEFLKSLGVAGVFGPGADTRRITETIQAKLEERDKNGPAY